MGRTVTIALFAVVMAALIVLVDVLFLRHQLVLRLVVNVGIVAVFAAAYVGFRNHV